MATTLKEKMKALDARRRRKVEARAAELIAEEMSLRDLRRALEMTQVRMAEVLGIGQEGVSRVEKRSDLLLSTLRGYVEAMGGKLTLIAEFPERPPVVLSGVADMEEVRPRHSRRADKRNPRPAGAGRGQGEGPGSESSPSPRPSPRKRGEGVDRSR